MNGFFLELRLRNRLMWDFVDSAVTISFLISMVVIS